MVRARFASLTAAAGLGLLCGCTCCQHSLLGRRSTSSTPQCGPAPQCNTAAAPDCGCTDIVGEPVIPEVPALETGGPILAEPPTAGAVITTPPPQYAVPPLAPQYTVPPQGTVPPTPPAPRLVPQPLSQPVPYTPMQREWR